MIRTRTLVYGPVPVPAIDSWPAEPEFANRHLKVPGIFVITIYLPKMVRVGKRLTSRQYCRIRGLVAFDRWPIGYVLFLRTLLSTIIHMTPFAASLEFLLLRTSLG